MTSTPQVARARFDKLHEDLTRLSAALRGVLVGQDTLVEELLCAVVAGGHVLLEGLPGLGKTQLVKALARALDLPLGRIQCTPDLMPSDVTGSEVLVHDASGSQQLEFRHGPVFCSLLLVDEINRATPKTQSAFLEAMQERQITWLGHSHPLPDPFWLLATQNPIELEGTYPLPEAQLDRFLCQLCVAYPDADALTRMLEISLDAEPAEQLAPVLDARRINAIVAGAREVLIATPLREAAVALVLATQPGSPGAHMLAREHLRYGASPRGLQALLRVARARALMHGRVHVAAADLRDAALPALRHRVVLSVDSELDGLRIDALLSELVTDVLDRCGLG